jgi:RHS repeat-associated protein
VDGGNTATYTYDAEGRRASKNTFTYLYDLAGHQVAELNSGSWDRGEVHAGGRHLATYSGGTTYFPHVDWLGTERVRTNTAGNIVETCISLPFGDGQSCTGSDSSPMHFTGKQRDTESNLDYFDARFYSSTEGRFARPDESFADQDTGDPQSWNMYTYAVNNPLLYTDPSGMSHLDANGYWVGDSNGECEQQNGGTVCWNAKANNGNGEWQAPPRPKMDNGAVSPGMLGPGDLILFSQLRFPSVLTDILGPVFGTTAETSIKTAGETAAKAGAGKPNVEVLRATAAPVFFLLRKTAIGAVRVHDDVDFGACVKRQVGGDGRLLQPRGPKAAKVNPKRVRFV